MAGAGLITLTGNVSGGPDGGRTFGPVSITADDAVAYEVTQALAVGANAVAVPTGCTAMILWPPNAVGAAEMPPNPPFGGLLTLKGAAGDVGVPLSASWPTELAWDDPPAAIVIAATVACSIVLWAM